MDVNPAREGKELCHIYLCMLAAVAAGVTLAVLLHVLWPDARGPVAWLAVACGTVVWGGVETPDLHLSLGRAMLLFEVGLASFALAGVLLLLLGAFLWFLALSVGVVAFLRALDGAFRQRTDDARRRAPAPPST
jgi:hypothetical protein